MTFLTHGFWEAACDATDEAESGYCGIGDLAAALGLTSSAFAFAKSQAASSQKAGAPPSVQGTAGAAGATNPGGVSDGQHRRVRAGAGDAVLTHYRTEYRTENVPVTRMVPEVVNETRTITRFVPTAADDQQANRHSLRLRADHGDEEMLPPRSGDQERAAHDLPDELHDGDRQQGDHPLCSRMCHRDGAGDANA